jgi:hypothetical protein
MRGLHGVGMIIEDIFQILIKTKATSTILILCVQVAVKHDLTI